MELDISELDNMELENDIMLDNTDLIDMLNDNFDQHDSLDEQILENEILEDIPENIIPKKVVKNVDFNSDVKNNLNTYKPTHQSIPKVNAKMVRSKMPSQTPKISYEDILSKMGMYVSNGKLHLIDRNSLTLEKRKELLDSQKRKQQQNQKQNQKQNQNQNQNQQQEPINNIHNVQQNSYIYNKLFKDQIQPEVTVRKPKTLQEYKIMLIEDYVKRERIKQIKSRRLMMPTSNINISDGESFPRLQNRLFSLSKR
jgi:hypothetical protein